MRHIFFRLFAGLVLIAAIVGIGVLAYNAGIAHQAAITPTGGAQTNPVIPAYTYWWPFPFFGLGFFGLIAVFFLLSIAFSALRFMLWGPRWGWHRWHRGYGNWGERGEGEQPPIPPMMAEMHRRMHAADQGQSTGQDTQKPA
jgi:hypothetical protein